MGDDFLKSGDLSSEDAKNPWRGWSRLSGEEKVGRYLEFGARGDDVRFDNHLFPKRNPTNHLKLISVTFPSSASSPSSSPSSTTTTKSPNPTHTDPTSLATTTFEYTIPAYFANATRENLHGGAAATIFDDCTWMSLAPLSRPGFWMLGGVSRRLSVTYLRPARVGDVVRIVCHVISIGRSLANLRAVMVRASDGVVLSTCDHDKVNSDPPVMPVPDKGRGGRGVKAKL